MGTGGSERPVYPFTYCPRCGQPTQERTLFGRTRRVCPHCHLVFFHDLKVAVGALITNGNRVLLVRRAVNPERGKWALPAGYMEHDEAPLTALRREVAEETGLDITVTRLLDVFPLTNPDARGVIIMYQARPVGEVPEHPSAADDIDAARWFAPEEIRWQDLAFESTRSILRRWCENSDHQGADSG